MNENSLNLEKIRENSNLSEGTEATDVSLVNTMLSDLINEKYNSSLAYQICEVFPISSSQGSIYASKKNLNGDMEIVKKEIFPTIKNLETGFTLEALEDIRHTFGKDIKKLSKMVLGGISEGEENQTLIDFLDNESEIKTFLTLSNPNNLRTSIYEISKKVSDSIIEMNKESYNTLDGFCILSPSWASSILGSSLSISEGDKRLLFVGKVGRCNYYVNPIPPGNQFDGAFNSAFANNQNANIEYNYVGLMSEVSGHSSIVFSPHSYEIKYVTDPQTGNNKIFIYNRYDINTSPLHNPSEGISMLHKFEIRT